MKRLLTFGCFSILLFFFSCSSQQDALNLIDKKFQQYLRKELKVKITTLGTFNYGEGLEYMVQTEKAFDVYQSRIYVLGCLNYFHKLVEQNDPKLLENKSLSEIIDITFAFCESSNERQPPPNIAAVFFSNNSLKYYTYPNGKLVEVHEESLLKAKKKVGNALVLSF